MWKWILGLGVGSNAGGPSSIRGLAGRPVQCVAWQLWQQVGQPGGLDRGVGGLVGWVDWPGRTGTQLVHPQLLAPAILDNSVGDQPG